MAKIKHLYIRVDSDEKELDGFTGDLAEFAAERLNQRLTGVPARVISIESTYKTDHICPRMDNSDTWYYRDSIRLSVWYEDAAGLSVSK